MKNFERFDNPASAYLAWASETQNTCPADYEFEDEDEWDQMQDLWTQVFQDDQNREFVDWLWEEAKDGEEKGAKRAEGRHSV